MRLSAAIPLLNPVEAYATASAPTAAFGIFCGLQIAEFDQFLRFFLCHFIRLSHLRPFVNSRPENSFWPFTEIVRKIRGEVMRRAQVNTIV